MKIMTRAVIYHYFKNRNISPAYETRSCIKDIIKKTDGTPAGTVNIIIEMISKTMPNRL